MRAHVDRCVVLIYPPGLLQATKEVAHAAHVVTRLGHHLKTQAISFSFIITTVGQLRLNRAGLCRRNRSTGDLRVGTGSQYADGHRNHAGDRILFLAGNLPGQVILHHMRDFMCKYASQFRLRLRRQQGTGVHADETAEHRKRIDRVIANKEELTIA
ncbi:MAG: hypothetical protein CAPSK01_000442 [Candidatus Accumulibacter vicinus]|uniref:Uncharacterized protein n=1 Tax=Candidatus Accumulibacter vicinus TaxID=2954382 RepID=A0A084Y5P9_9PROT|nr:MAG: hypothetical protein CAPSK01_000442 [Candidatus Accumulibacter vicinus]